MLPAVIDEIGFSVVKYRQETPVLARCTRCELKFLTPSGMTDPQAANDYLLNKYFSHRCVITGKPKLGKQLRDPRSIIETSPRAG